MGLGEANARHGAWLRAEHAAGAQPRAVAAAWRLWAALLALLSAAALAGRGALRGAAARPSPVGWPTPARRWAWSVADPAPVPCGGGDLLRLLAAHPALPALRHEATLRSAKRRRPTDVAIVTQLSLDRLPLLEGQCAAWGGAIAAAVHAPLAAGDRVVAAGAEPGAVPLSDVLVDVAAFHTRVDAAAPCKLDLVVWSEAVAGDWVPAVHYPYNALRNRALSAAVDAGAELLFSLDVDFWPSRELSEAQASPAAYAALRRAARVPLVVAALEAADEGGAGAADARAAAAGGKPAALRLLRARRLRMFKTRDAPSTHAATDLARWGAARRGAAPYCIAATQRYEPYVILRADATPWFDERFSVGRGDKIQHLRALAAMSGGHFRVHPAAFVVHAPHEKAPGKSHAAFAAAAAGGAALFDAVVASIAAGNYTPVAAMGCGAWPLGPRMAGGALPVARGPPCAAAS